MSQVIQEKQEQKRRQEADDDEPTFVPYGFRPGIGDCAETDNVKDVSKAKYGEQASFRVAGRLRVKNAP